MARRCPQCGKEHPADAVYCIEDGTPLVEVQPGEETGVDEARLKVLGAYRLLGVLGEGGMGRVYLAEHTSLGRRVALKMLREEYANNPDAVRRFFNEARVVNRIRHENIVEITDFVEQPGGDNYYIMELLEGASLLELLVVEKALPAERAVAIALQMCAALEAAHREGVVHRDLKAENIFLVEKLGSRDFVKILDFGVAKLLDVREQDAMKTTAAGTVVGTVDYMAPEQARGDTIDNRADIYAFGILLYEMVTGERPFSGKSIGEVVAKHLGQKPPRPGKASGLRRPLPAGLESLILQCLEKRPSARPESMAAIAERLAEMAMAAGWELQPVGRASLSGLELHRFRSPGGGRRKLLLAFVVVLLVAGGVSLAAWHWLADTAGAKTEQPATRGPPAMDAGAAEPASTRQTVAVDIRSDPPGADVWRDGADRPAGRTPLRLVLARSTSPVRFELRKEGYRTEVEEVAPLEDATVTVALRESTEPDPPGRDAHRRKKRKKHRAGSRRAPKKHDEAKAALRVPGKTAADGRTEVKNVEPANDSSTDRNRTDSSRYDRRGTVDPFEQVDDNKEN